MIRLDLENELNGILCQLNDDELKAIIKIADRILLGQQKYGELNLSKETRDWKKERDEEIQDLLIYTAFESLKRGQ